MVLTERVDPAQTVLWVIPVSNLAGVARHVLDTAKAGAPGWRLIVCCPEGDLAVELRKLGTPVVTGIFGPEASFLASAKFLRQTIRALNPMIVHSHLAYADIMAAIVLAFNRKIQLVTTEHGISGVDAVYHRSSTRARVKALVHTIRIRRADAVIAVSNATRDAMVSKWRPRQPIAVIPNGVDRVLVPESKKEDLDPPAVEGPLRMLSLSRLSPEKQLPELIRAFARLHERHPNSVLTIAGEGPLRRELSALVESLDLQGTVEFPGFIEAGTALETADILIQLSAWENCSYSLLDAVAHGLGIVATPVGGNPELLPASSMYSADDVDGIVSASIQQAEDVNSRPVLSPQWPTVMSMVQSTVDVYTKVVDK